MLYTYVNWRFLYLRQAFAQAVWTSSQMAVVSSQTLLVYSDVVRSNAVGDMEHPLIQQVPYKDDGSGSFYFEPQQVQWMPLGRPYLDVIEVQIGSSQRALVNFGSGKTIITFRFRRTTSNYDHGLIGVVERRIRRVPPKDQQQFYGVFAGTFTAGRTGMGSGSVVAGHARCWVTAQRTEGL